MIGAKRIDEICVALAALGPVEVKRMFGGAGVYLDGRIFAMIHRHALYAKVDKDTEARFEEAGCAPFEPAYKDGRRVRMPYRRLPDEAQQPGAAMLRWARLGLAAARRAPVKPRPAARASKTSGPETGTLGRKRARSSVAGSFDGKVEK